MNKVLKLGVFLLVIVVGIFVWRQGSKSKSVSFVIPAKGQYKLGEVFSVKIEIDGVKTPINAVQADLAFDPARVEAVEVSTENSFADIFIQKEIDNQKGYVRLTGGLPSPGFSGEKGLFGTVFFKSKTPGIAKIEFLPTSMVLANDNKGTNVLKDFAQISYLILPEKISQQEENSQKAILGKNTDETQMVFYGEK